MSLAWMFFKRDAITATSYRTSFVVTLAGNFVLLIVCFFIGKMIGDQDIPALEPYGGNFLAFLLIGIALTDSVGISLTTFANQIREGQTTGSLEATLMSPARLPAILFYSSLWSYFLSGTGLFFSDLGLENANMGAGIVIFLLTVTAFAGFGMIWASVVMLVKRGDSIMSLAGSMIVLFSGVLFPVSELPDWMSSLSSLIPLTHGLEAMRLALIQGLGLGDMLDVVFKLLAFTVIFLVAGVLAFNGSIWLSKEGGSLSQF